MVEDRALLVERIGRAESRAADLTQEVKDLFERLQAARKERDAAEAEVRQARHFLPDLIRDATPYNPTSPETPAQRQARAWLDRTAPSRA